MHLALERLYIIYGYIFIVGTPKRLTQQLGGLPHTHGPAHTNTNTLTRTAIPANWISQLTLRAKKWICDMSLYSMKEIVFFGVDHLKIFKKVYFPSRRTSTNNFRSKVNTHREQTNKRDARDAQDARDVRMFVPLNPKLNYPSNLF